MLETLAELQPLDEELPDADEALRPLDDIDLDPIFAAHGRALGLALGAHTLTESSHRARPAPTKPAELQ